MFLSPPRPLVAKPSVLQLQQFGIPSHSVSGNHHLLAPSNVISKLIYLPSPASPFSHPATPAPPTRACLNLCAILICNNNSNNNNNCWGLNDPFCCVNRSRCRYWFFAACCVRSIDLQCFWTGQITPKNFPFLWEISRPTHVSLPNGSRFCRAHESDQQTDTQTDHATPSVSIARILYNACDSAL